MAGAKEFAAAVVPVVGAAEVGALRPEGSHGIIGVLHHPGGRFLAGDFPAVDAVAAESEFGGRIDGKLGEVAGVDPFVSLSELRGQEEISEPGDTQGGGDDCPDGVYGADVEPASGDGLGRWRHGIIVYRRARGLCQEDVKFVGKKAQRGDTENTESTRREKAEKSCAYFITGSCAVAGSGP